MLRTIGTFALYNEVAVLPKSEASNSEIIFQIGSEFPEPLGQANKQRNVSSYYLH